MSHQSDLIQSDIHGYLSQHENKQLLRLLTCGSVDDGKSTLIGRLLHDSKMIFEDQLAAITRDSKKSGTQGDRVDLALLVDGLAAEREQGITIDVAYRYFSTDKRKFIIADTPGHEQYTRNMATGASTADLAIILIDARHGVQVQTKRHSYISHLLGIRHLVVAINKMDLVGYSEQVFQKIQQDYLAFAKPLGIQDIQFVPISALEGDNVVSPSLNMPWFTGQPLMGLLEVINIDHAINYDGFRLPVQYVNRPNLNFRGFCGTVASGVIQVGDELMVLPSGKTSKVKSIPSFDGDQQQAFAGQAVTLCLTDEIDISRGDILVDPKHKPLVSNELEAELVWMHEQRLQPGKLYDIKLGTNTGSGSFTQIHYRTDVNSLEQTPANELELNEIGRVSLTLNKAMAFDPYHENRQTGSFIVIDRLSNVTIGAGMIRKVASTQTLTPVNAQDRELRFAQRAALIQVKDSTQAQQLERRLFNAGHAVIALNEVDLASAQALLQAGLIVICASSAAAFDLVLDSAKLDDNIRQLTAAHILK